MDTDCTGSGWRGSVVRVWDGEVFDDGEGSEESRGGYAGMGRCLLGCLFWGHRTQKDPARAQMTPVLLHYYFYTLHNTISVILLVLLTTIYCYSLLRLSALTRNQTISIDEMFNNRLSRLNIDFLVKAQES